MATLESIGLEDGYAQLGDVRLHYVEAGEGPLVVLLHGFPEFWFGWRRQIPALAEAGFRVVAPDMRGYNLSSRPEGIDGVRHRPAGGRRPRPDPRAGSGTGLPGRTRLGRGRPPGRRRRTTRRWWSGWRSSTAPIPAGCCAPCGDRASSPGPGTCSSSSCRGYRSASSGPRLGGASRRVRRRAAGGLHAAGHRALRRGVVAAGRPDGDAQLLPRGLSPAAPRAGRGAGRSRPRPWSSGASAIATSAPSSPSPTLPTSPTWSASSACPTPRTGCSTKSPSGSGNC